MSVYFCTFADLNLLTSLKRIGKQAKELGIFDKIFLYSENNLPKYALKRCQSIIKATNSRKGFGYYSWKPAVILDAMQKIDYQDILIYTDAGSHLNKNGKTKLMKYISDTEANDILITQLNSELCDLKYTKNDTIDLFRQRLLTTAILNTGQIQGGNIFLIKNDYTLSLMEQFNELMSEKNVHYFDDSPSYTPNYQDFVTNRHDQSIFSLLLKCNHYGVINGEFYAKDETGWQILKQTEPILNKRDKEFKQYLTFKDKIALLYRRIKSLAKR